MKLFIALLLVFATLISCSNAQKKNDQNTETVEQSKSYKAWQKEAEKEIRLNPKYKNAVKTEAQKAADEQLIKSNETQEGSRRKGSERLVKIGFDYLYKGDLRTAMYRFNQAWLLDSTDVNVYSGFASIYFSFQDYKRSIALLDEGLAIDPNASGLLTDKATNYIALSQSNHSKSDMERGLSLLKASYEIDPLNQSTLYKLSVFYFEIKNCDMAVKYYKECMKLGGSQIAQGYSDALKTTCGI